MAQPVKRSVTIAGHRTSITLEPEFWSALKEIACTEGRSVSAIVRDIDAERTGEEGLSTATRLYILRHFRERAACAVAGDGSPSS